MISRPRIKSVIRRRDDGATGVSYAGLLMLSAAIFGLLVSVGPDSISSPVHQAACRLFHRECGHGDGVASRPRPTVNVEPPQGGGVVPPAPRSGGGGALALRPRLSRFLFDSVGNLLIKERGPSYGGQATAPDPGQVNKVFNDMGLIRDYLWDHFRRDSYDGRGSPMNVRIQAGVIGGAHWSPSTKAVEVGEYSAHKDTIAREFFRAIIDNEVKFSRAPQSAALREALAEMFATNVDGNWELGEGTYDPATKKKLGPIGNLADPTSINPRSAVHVREYDPVGRTVYENSSILGIAYYEMVSRMGRPTAEQIIYQALTRHLKKDSGFEDFRAASLEAAEELYGRNGSEYGATNSAFSIVGLNGTWKEKH